MTTIPAIQLQCIDEDYALAPIGEIIISVTVVSGAIGTGGINTVDLDIIDGTNYTFPAGKKLDSISVLPSGADRTLTIGTTPSGTEVLEDMAIAANTSPSAALGIYFHNGATLSFSGFVGTVKLYIL